MTLEELRLLRVIQGILVRNYVNTQKMDVQVIGSSVYLEGDFEIFEYRMSSRRKDPVERDLEGIRALLHIEKQIRSLAEITHLEFKFNNWQRSGVAWTRRHHL
ncbi:hypothetical protein HQ590_08160 [bacterium]|nr:hypothetical protein [bacterium]